MIATTLLALFASPLHEPAPSLKEALATLAAAHEREDAAAARALFGEAPHWAALVVAADLESGLALREGGAEAAEVEPLFARARWAGRAASEAGLPLVGEWAAALSDLEANDLRRYRQGQARYQTALELAAAGEAERAMETVMSACDHALVVGDLWGAALAWRERAELERGWGSFEEALVSYSNARRLDRALGLAPDELDALVQSATLAAALELDRRGLELVDQAFALRARLTAAGLARGADPGERALLLRARATMQERAGDTGAAAATRRELEER